MGGGLANADVIKGGGRSMLAVADRGGGGQRPVMSSEKNFQ